MPLTPNHQLPYPAESDEPDVPADIYALANRLDSVLTALTLTSNERIRELELRVETLTRQTIGEVVEHIEESLA